MSTGGDGPVTDIQPAADGPVVVYRSRSHVVFVVMFLFALIGPPIGAFAVWLTDVPNSLMDARYGFGHNLMQTVQMLAIIMTFGLLFAYPIGIVPALLMGLSVGILQARGRRAPLYAVVAAALVVAVGTALYLDPFQHAGHTRFSIFSSMIAFALMHLLPSLVCWHFVRNIVLTREETAPASAA